MAWDSCSEYDSLVRNILSGAADDIDRGNQIPDEILAQLIDAGLFTLEGGIRDLLCRVRVLSRYSPAVAHSLLVHASAWLAAGKPNVGRGEILALSVTEPKGGTDIKASLSTSADRTESGIVITGEKIFTSNAPYAKAFVVLAMGVSGPTLYWVEKSENVEYELLDLTGLRGTGASIVRYHEAPATRLGTPGKGLKEALRGINLGRLGYGAIALGILDRSLQILVEVGRSKIIFGRELLSYQGIKWRIADIYSDLTLLESLINQVASAAAGTWTVDPEKAAIVKVRAAEAAQKAAWSAAQIMGGRGLRAWSIVDRMQRDARALDIGEGAREVLLDYIAGQAVKAVG